MVMERRFDCLGWVQKKAEALADGRKGDERAELLLAGCLDGATNVASPGLLRRPRTGVNGVETWEV